MSKKVIVSVDKLNAIANAVNAKTGLNKGLSLDDMAVKISDTWGIDTYLKNRTMYDYLFCGYAQDKLPSITIDTSTIETTEWSVCDYSISALCAFSKIKEYNGEIKFVSGNLKCLESMFCNCSSLISVSGLDFSSLTNVMSMFQNCSSLTDVSGLDFNFSNLTDDGADYLFSGCEKLTEIGNINFSNITNLHSCFKNCSSLVKIGNLTFKNSKVFISRNNFEGCTKLTTIGKVSFPENAELKGEASDCFAYLTNLQNITFEPECIGVSFSFGSNKKLTSESISSIINGLKSTQTAKTITFASSVNVSESQIAAATQKGWTVAQI